MFLSHPHHPIHAREIRSLALLALVLALSVLAASELKGAPDLSGPGHRSPPAAANEGFDALTLWQVLTSHRAGHLCDAIVRWKNIPLPAESQVCRQVAWGVAQLESGGLEQAVQNLAAAEKLDAKNPIVHYFLGMWRLEQASKAHDYYDAIGTDSIRLFAQMTPTVADLLRALGTENYVGRAHNVLGYMYLDRDSLEQAEEHMDAAAESGIDKEIGYRDLARKYRFLGREFDARRAILKALKQGAVPSDEFFDGYPERMIPSAVRIAASHTMPARRDRGNTWRSPKWFAIVAVRQQRGIDTYPRPKT